MSESRRIKRQQERMYVKHMSMLGELLGRFYTFLEKDPKPSDSEVRTTFAQYDKQWRSYCSKNQLNQHATLLFNQEVAQSWKNRYAKKDSATQN